MFSDQDFHYMRGALTLSLQALYSTTPNPRVGCVLVKDEQIIGQGFTQPPGQNHAEVQALDDARRRGFDTVGATAYVTLEPCCHFGRTPPCADALIAAGIVRVVASMKDPNPVVSGKGFERLRSAGIEVSVGLLEDEARELNIGFVSRMTRGRPWVRLKTAASLDGATALLNNNSQWITGQSARIDGHAWRARACAILTGIGTVQQDNPRLDVREIATPRQPLRILLDSKLQVSLDSHLVRMGGLLIVCASDDSQKKKELVRHGCEVLHLADTKGQINLPLLMQELGKRGINELHVEAGARLNGALIRENCVDELLVYLAPLLLGPGKPMFDLPLLDDLNLGHRFAFSDVTKIGDDVRLMARLTNQGPPPSPLT